MKELRFLIWLYGALIAFVGPSMCHRPDYGPRGKEDPWDSVLNQNMPLTEHRSELRDSSAYFFERLRTLEHIAKIQKKKTNLHTTRPGI